MKWRFRPAGGSKYGAVVGEHRQVVLLMWGDPVQKTGLSISVALRGAREAELQVLVRTLDKGRKGSKHTL
jgi:hypothetical protein